MSTTDTRNQQSEPESLEPVADLTPRRRKELARELEEELADRGVRLQREVVVHPTELFMVSTHRHSRGRNHARNCPFSAAYLLLADRAAGLEPVEAAARLLTARAEFDAVVTMLLDRVVGLGEGAVDLQTAFDFEAREGAEDNVATIEALADQELSAEELREIESEATDAKAALQMKIRAVQRKRIEMEAGAA